MSIERAKSREKTGIKERAIIRKKPKRIFSLSENNKGLACPFEPPRPTPYPCQEGFCSNCQIYLDWQKLGELLVICAWCGKVIGKKDGLGQSGISHGICPDCYANFFRPTRQE